jgi:hypothetical protein
MRGERSKMLLYVCVEQGLQVGEGWLLTLDGKLREDSTI